MTDTTDVARYAAAVRAALADLEAGERESLLEDLEQHLAEVGADSDAPLATKLGAPEKYAAELRAAYGARKPGGQAGLLRNRRRYRGGVAIILAAAVIGGWLVVSKSHELTGGGLRWINVLMPNLILLLLILGFLYYVWTYAAGRRGGGA
jgi:hypothetical protein